MMNQNTRRNSGNDSGLSLLFDAGKRPDFAAIRAMASRSQGFDISQDHVVASEGGPEDCLAIELLIDGFTFDLSGLGGGAGARIPDCVYRFALPEDIDSLGVEAVTLRAGPHLADGAHLQPVVQLMLRLSAHLCELDGVQAIAWHPGRTWIGPDYFRSITRNWIEGGIFPGLGLIGLEPSADGALQSEGLAYFVGQELRIEPELAEDRGAATRIGIRLIDYLSMHGALAHQEAISGPEGRPLRIEPSANGHFVRVWGA